MRYPLQTVLTLLLLQIAAIATAAEFNIRDYGATPDDETDDTLAVRAALDACATSGGGVVLAPAGTYLVSRQKNESPILPIPSNTILRGEGTASTFKFPARVNDTNFWRMLGAAPGTCRNITVCDLRLDGSNTYGSYEPGKTPEHNHGMFFSTPDGVIENVLICNLLVENFSGDCIGVGQGCRNVVIREVQLRNFIRQGIQMAGGNGGRDYTVTRCQDLEPTVQPGGSTIHVEHARGLQNVNISDNLCRNSILAGGVDGLILRHNIVAGQIAGNGNSNLLAQGNIVRGSSGGKQFLMQFGYSDGLVLRDNLLLTATEGQGGIYVWGTSRYNPSPSRNVLVTGNSVRRADKSISAGNGVLLSGVEDGVVRDNLFDAGFSIVAKRVKQVSIRPADSQKQPQ